MKKDNTKIQLDSTMLIGKGRDRVCYIHPADDSLCIKVAINREKQSRREKRYLNFLKKRGKDLSLLSDYKGVTKTNLGVGHIFELARDDKGNVAPSLKTAIQNKLISENEVEQLILKIEAYITEQSICAYDLSPNNIVVLMKDHKNINCKIIDGVGVAKPNPLSIRLDSLILKSQKHSLARLRRKAQLLIEDFLKS